MIVKKRNKCNSLPADYQFIKNGFMPVIDKESTNTIKVLQYKESFAHAAGLSLRLV